jgi:tetratricopeptide (TPR) repeat protein
MKRNLFLIFFCFLIFATAGLNAQDYDNQALRYLKSGVANLMSGNYIKAIEDCTRVIRLDPNSPVTYVMRARAYYELGEMDRAIADCTLAIRRDRENVGAYLIRGNAYGNKGDLDKAVSDWQAILKINPDFDEAKLNIEKADLQRGL